MDYIVLSKLAMAGGRDIELDTVGRQFEPYRWRLFGVTWDAVPEQSSCGEPPPSLPRISGCQ